MIPFATMTELNRIDNPVDAEFADILDDSEPGAEAANVALAISGLCFPAAAIFKILTDQFDANRRKSRVCELIKSLRIVLRKHEERLVVVENGIREANSRLDSSEFREAVIAASEEAARATNERTIDRMAAVLAGFVSPGKWRISEDLATSVRDISQLGELDIRILGMQRKVYFDDMNSAQFPFDPKMFTARMKEMTAEIAASGIDLDDFYGGCRGWSASVCRSKSPTIQCGQG